ncbi:MAG: hypothetical protein D6693_06740 [Planctomycetota bacterium]|nr:MAG: hypothetical protein D6693_06740 [Planctomycetota bacterium]
MTDQPLSGVLDAIAAKTPTPGGGATAALAGALAAAQAEMVVAYSLGKKDLAEHQEALADARGRLGRSRALFLELAEEDAAAYGLVSELLRLDARDPRRAAELPAAVGAATRVPLACVANATALARLCLTLAPITNPHLASDLAIAALLAEACARAGAENVRVNLPALAEHAGSGAADAARRDLDRLLADAADLADRTRRALEG